MTVTFDTAALEADLAAIKLDIERNAGIDVKNAIHEAAEATNEHGYQNKTGELTGTRTEKVTTTASGIAGEITWPAKYAKFVDEPTKAHEIVARKAKMLRYYVRGQVVFRHRVWHPGTKGARFSDRAWYELAFTSSDRLQSGVDSAIQAHP